MTNAFFNIVQGQAIKLQKKEVKTEKLNQILHIKQEIEQHEPHKNTGVYLSAPEQ